MNETKTKELISKLKEFVNWYEHNSPSLFFYMGSLEDQKENMSLYCASLSYIEKYD